LSKKLLRGKNASTQRAKGRVQARRFDSEGREGWNFKNSRGIRGELGGRKNSGEFR